MPSERGLEVAPNIEITMKWCQELKTVENCKTRQYRKLLYALIANWSCGHGVESPFKGSLCVCFFLEFGFFCYWRGHINFHLSYQPFSRVEKKFSLSSEPPWRNRPYGNVQDKDSLFLQRQNWNCCMHSSWNWRVPLCDVLQIMPCSQNPIIIALSAMLFDFIEMHRCQNFGCYLGMSGWNYIANAWINGIWQNGLILYKALSNLKRKEPILL